MTATFVSTVLTFALAAGCSDVTTQTTAGGANAWSHPGVLRLGVRQQPDNLNTMLGQEAIDVDISMFWAGYLLGHDDKDELIPELATEVPSLKNGGISKDGRTITYHLRSGATWQDGRAFTADDVIYSWHAVMDLDNPVPTRSGYELIRSIEKRGANDIVVSLSHPYAPFVDDFFTPLAAYAYCLLPQHIMGPSTKVSHADFNRKPIGTGPFQVEEYEPDSHIRLLANPHYWRGAPNLREVDIRIVSDDNTLATLLKTHEIDFFYRAPHTISRTLRDVAGVSVVSAPFKRYSDLAFNLSSSNLSDVRVRRALAYGTDKKAIDEKIFEGADIVTDSDQPEFSWAHDFKLKGRPYDPEQAEALLESAGWSAGPDGIRQKNGEALRIVLAGETGDAGSTSTRALIQSQWRRIGVDAEIKSYPTDILYASQAEGGIEHTGKFDVVLEGFASGDDPNDSELFECKAQPPAGENIYRFCDRTLDALEEHALLHNDRKTRKADYDRIQAILDAQLPFLPLTFVRYDYVVNTDLRNFSPAPAGTPFWNTWAWDI